MASVSWQYPQDALIALRRQNAAASRRAGRAEPRCLAAALPLCDRGRQPALAAAARFRRWRQVFIEFPRGIGQGELPPLFVIGRKARASSSITASGRIYDRRRLFAAAELRLGQRQQTVRIVRTDGVRRGLFGGLRMRPSRSIRPGAATAEARDDERGRHAFRRSGEARSERDIAQALRLRPDPPRVMRLSRKV